jgi:hypothetical protein
MAGEKTYKGPTAGGEVSQSIFRLQLVDHGQTKMARRRRSGGRFEAPCPPKSTGKVVEGGEIVKRVGVETDEFPHKNILVLEAEAVPKSRHDDDVRATGEGVSDPMQRPVRANQTDDVMVLIAKAMETLMDRQTPRGMTKRWGEARRGG